MFNIDTETLNQLESEGKIKAMLVMGNKKLYLLSELKDIKPENSIIVTKPVSFFKRFFSWFRRGK